MPYTLGITFGQTSTTYKLMTSVATGKQLLETKTIPHSSCSSYKQGSVLGLYFGGECPAPQQVGVCYTTISA